MPAKSKTQQRLFGMAVAYKKGDLDTSKMDSDLINKIKSLADNMTKKELEEFAKTKHDNLPEKVKNEQKVFTFDQFINEEFIGKYKKADFYKNPKSIKRMSPWMRAISDRRGNFYIVDDDNYELLHDEMYTFLRIDNHIQEDEFEYARWQRVGKTNNFYTGEYYSYMDHDTDPQTLMLARHYRELIKEHIKLLKKTNPQYTFHKDGIWKYYKEPRTINDMRAGVISKK